MINVLPFSSKSNLFTLLCDIGAWLCKLLCQSSCKEIVEKYYPSRFRFFILTFQPMTPGVCADILPCALRPSSPTSSSSALLKAPACPYFNSWLLLKLLLVQHL